MVLLVTPPDAATKWRRPEALHWHCALPGTYIASTHSQSNARILELFFHDNVTFTSHTWALTCSAMHGLNTSSSTEHGRALNIGRIFLLLIFLFISFYINIVSNVDIYFFDLNVQTYRVKELMIG